MSTTSAQTLSNTSLDSSFWPEKRGPFVEYATVFWRFSLYRDVEKVTVFIKRDKNRVACTLHMSHAPILAFLDFSLRHYIGMAEAGRRGAQRIAHYLRKLCVGVENEIEAEDPGILVLETWRSAVLQDWAVRTGEGYGYSETGRTEYMKACVEKKVQANSIDIIKSYDWESYIKSCTQKWEHDSIKSDSLQDAPYSGKERFDSLRLLTIEVLPYYEIKTMLFSCQTIPSWEKTVLPFARKDVTLVRLMAQSPNRNLTKQTSPTDVDDFIITLEKDPSMPQYAQDRLIRESLANQRCVIVRGHLEGPESFTKEDVGADMGALSRIVRWHDAKSASTEANKLTTLEGFIESSNNPNVCGNMDATCLRSSCPLVISRIADDARAFELTIHDSYASLPFRVPSKLTRPYKTLTEDQKQRISGSKVIRQSSWRALQRSIITHAGYTSHQYKSANGFCTWIYAHVGVKIWAIIRPKYTVDHDTLHKVNTLHKTIMQSKPEELNKHADIFPIFLSSGEILILPPGVWQAVYTPTSAYCSAGHFFTYETMHLTEQSRRFDHIYPSTPTDNDDQVGRILSRMALAINQVLQNRNLYRRPFFALARMILNHDDYTQKTESSQKSLTDQMTEWDILYQEETGERDEAQRTIRMLFESIQFNENDLDKEVMCGGSRWMALGDFLGGEKALD